MKSNILKMFVFLVGASFAACAMGQIIFDPGVSYGVGQRPDGIAAADFDGDGDKDLAVVTDGATGALELIEIWLNNGDGTYTAGPVVFLPNSSSPNELIAADLDGDTDVDMAVVLRDFQLVQTVVNNGGGIFSLGSTASVGDRARGMTARDYDGDTDIDLAVANRNDNTATILTNNGAGSFSSLTIAAGDEPRAAAFVDIDGNANIDFAVTNHDDRTVSLYTNSGGGFSPMGTVFVGGVHRPDGLAAADLNADGLDDLAVAISDDIAPDAAMVFINQGGSFGAGTMYVTNGQNTSGIVASDLDCDGTLDLATLNQDSNDFSLLQNLGGGVFGAPTTMSSSGVRPSQIIASDLDGDGDADIAISNRDSNNFAVSINQTCDDVVAILTSVDVTVGTVTSGGIVDLVDDDDFVLQTRSGFGRTFVDLHNMTMEVSAVSNTPSPTSVTVSIASRIGEPSGQAQIFLADWTNNGEPTSIGNYAIADTEERVTLDPQDASRFVNADGEILVTIKHIVFAPHFAFQFDSFIDQVEIVVQ